MAEKSNQTVKNEGISPFRKLKRFIWRRLTKNFVLRWANEGRFIIEKKIIPSIKNKKVLLVGVADYVSDYPRKLEKNGNSVWTIDIDSNVAKYGAKKHIVGNVVTLGKYLKNDFFDVIIMNGVFGYGLDDMNDANGSLKSCYDTLKNSGLLVLGWRDISRRNIVVPKKLGNYRLFKTISFREIPTGYMTKENVVFEFLQK